MSEIKELNLKIADLELITIRTTPEDEASWMGARDQVNNLWVKWSRYYPKKSSKDILAMIALRFAQVYVVRMNDDMELESLLENFEHEIDRMILGTAESQPNNDEAR
ncbi:MAG: cell division protein ZapA [Muribaculaceae bacterium]|nr:cell division protein ZapA [Muribaculaceae bacterium]